MVESKIEVLFHNLFCSLERKPLMTAKVVVLSVKGILPAFKVDFDNIQSLTLFGVTLM